MACYHPMTVYIMTKLKINGKQDLRFNYPTSGNCTEGQIPCGQCIGCRLERSRQWAMRCLHEAQMHDENCFITLTYDDEHVPYGNTLVIKHFQLFMKKLLNEVNKPYYKERREKPESEWKLKLKKIRYYECGEYGENFGRPHYHACLFGFDFNDKELIKDQDGMKLYTSKTLENIWGKGMVSIGEVNYDTAAYVARYIMKKINGDNAEEHYTTIDKTTGEYFYRQPEYTTMSRRPGIGQPWLDKFKTDVYPHGDVIINARHVKPPKFYDSKYELSDPEFYEAMKLKRKKLAESRAHDNTPERLKVKEKIKQIKLKQLKRTLA